VGKGILNRGTQAHKSKVKYNRLAIAKKLDCNPVTRYIEEEKQKMLLDPLGYDALKDIDELHSRNRRKTDDHDRKITLLDLDDQENIRRLRETRVPKKLHNKLERQASEKGLEDNQVDRYIRSTLKKVERRMNRRKSD
jgi:hypothetical protein